MDHQKRLNLLILGLSFLLALITIAAWAIWRL